MQQLRIHHLPLPFNTYRFPQVGGWREAVSHLTVAAAKKKGPRERGVNGDLEDPNYTSKLIDNYAWWMADGGQNLFQHLIKVRISIAKAANTLASWGAGNAVTGNTYWPLIAKQPSNLLAPVNSGKINYVVDFGDIRLSLDMPSDAESTKEWKKNEDLIQKLFLPNFSMPLTYSNRKPKLDQASLAVAWRPMEDYVSGKMPIEADWPTIEKEFDEFRGIAKLGMQVNQEATTIAGTDQGTVQGMSGDFNLVLNCRLALQFDLEFALLATSSTSRADFSPRLFLDYMNIYMQFAAGNGDYQPPPMMSSLKHIANEIAADAKRPHTRVQKMTNDDGFIILRNGAVISIPEVNNAAKFVEQIDSTINLNTGEIKPPKSLGLSDRPVLTDWLNYKHSYADAEGTVHIINLTGARPLDDVTVRHMLDRDFGDNRIASFAGVIDNLAKGPIQDRAMNDFRVTSREDALASASKIVDRMTSTQWKCLLGVPLDQNDKNIDDPAWAQKAISMFRRLIADTAPLYAKDTTLPYKLKMDCLDFMYWIFRQDGKPLERFEALTRNYQDRKKRNTAAPVKMSKVSVSNLPGLANWGMMPHQVEVHSRLQQGTEAAFLGVDAGGGKTASFMADIMELLRQGKIRRPIMTVPGSLVGQWVEEINRMSRPTDAKGNPVGDSQINAFPITLTTLRRWTDNFGMSLADVRELIMSQPPNTIFITSFEFIRNDVEQAPYGSQMVESSVQAELLASCHFDYVGVDESQRTKNDATATSKALMMYAPFAKYIRNGSGTIVHNNPRDVLGQANTINPIIFNGSTEFNRDFGNLTETGKVSSWRSDAGREIGNRLAPFASWINIKRREWAYMLPTLQELFIRVEMTPNQKENYEHIRQELFDEIMRDKDLAKKMKEGKEEDQEAVEAALKRELANLEIWINNPGDAAPGTIAGRYAKEFREKRGVGGADLESPKVKRVNELLDIHRKGGTIGSGENSVTIAASPNKVIIFGYNHDVARHIYERCKYKSEAVHYSTDNREALQQFKNDPKIKYMFADETSINTGQNLQMADTMIRLQTLYSPGEQEQALARVMRPDVRGQFNRETLNFWWLAINDTLEIAKIGRMMSRILDKAKVDENANLSFQTKVMPSIEGIGLVPMSLDYIEQYSNWKRLDEKFNHVKGYTAFTDWENEQFRQKRLDIKAELEKKLKRKVKDSEVRQLAMVDVESTPIKGTAVGYRPMVPNGQPADPHDLGLVPLSKVLREGEEGSETEEYTVAKGDPVWTEFGPGQVAGLGSQSVRVALPLFGGELLLPRTEVYAITKMANLKKIQAKLNDPLRHGFTAFDPSKYKIKLDKVVDVDLTEVFDESEDEDEDERPRKGGKVATRDSNANKAPTVDLRVGMVNGSLAALFNHDKDVSDFVPNGWVSYPAYWETRISTLQGFTRWLDALEALEQKTQKTNNPMVINEHRFKDLENTYYLMKKNKGNLEKIRPIKPADIKSFFVLSRRMPKHPLDAHPYVFILDGVVHITFNETTQRKVIPLVRGIRVAGATPLQLQSPMYIKFFSSKAAVVAEMDKLKKLGVKLADPKETERDLKALR